MTINVVVKCPMGLAMGTDSLVTISGEPGQTGIVATIPHYSKLFSLEPFAAGVALNGDGVIAERTVEDIVSEFSEYYPTAHNPSNYNLRQLATDLVKKVNDLVLKFYGEKPPSLNLELIVGGYSKGQEAGSKRYPEIYSLRWASYIPTSIEEKQFVPGTISEMHEILNQDHLFGSYYGGQQWALDRFRYGLDDKMIISMWTRRHLLFDQACKYIFKKLKQKGIKIPKEPVIELPGLASFNIYSLISDYTTKSDNKGQQLIDEMKLYSLGKLHTMEGYFSLESAVSYCAFLISCAYAVDTFTLTLPTVGSEMKIATITRREGCKFRESKGLSPLLT